MKKTTKFAALVGALALVGTLSIASAPAASAAVTCGTVYVNATGASVSCGGTGQYRIIYSCPNVFAYETFWVKYGPWVNAGTSTTLNTGRTCNVFLNRPYAYIAKR